MSAISNQPVHYLLVHPEREEHAASGYSYTTLGRMPWTGRVWVDPIDGTNEDPFVWCLPWLYSYCKATGLRRKPGSKPHLMAGSIIIFADKELAKKGTLSVDTVFMVGDVHIWSAGHPPTSLPNQMNAPGHPAFDRHLRFGIRGNSNHEGTYTYSGKPLKRFKGPGSFIPIDKEGHRVTMPFSALGGSLEHAIKTRLVHRLPPILLGQNQVNVMLREIWALTTHAVSAIGRAQPRSSHNEEERTRSTRRTKDHSRATTKCD